jgi:ABC-type Fe3+-hydroxamate transport system substrate-binding protein
MVIIKILGKIFMKKIIDIAGNEIQLKEPPERIVSLVPSLTETIIDLGCVNQLAGCTGFCLEIEGTAEAREIGGVRDPDIELIRSLNPDLVLAGREENQKKDIEMIKGFSRVYVCEPRTVGDAIGIINDIGVLLHETETASAWARKIHEYRVKLNELRQDTTPVRFGYLVWWDPMMVAAGDTYISSLLEEGPFLNAFGDMKRYPQVEESELINRDMDIIFISSEPYGFDDNLIGDIRKLTGDIPVERIDGRMCGWYGTGTCKGLKYILEQISDIQEKAGK